MNANKLKGESLPLPGTVDSTDDNYLETRCIGLQGTHCISGSGIGVVVSTGMPQYYGFLNARTLICHDKYTGDKTVFGTIAKLTNEPKTGMTTLEKEVLNFVMIICSIMFAMIILVLIVW